MIMVASNFIYYFISVPTVWATLDLIDTLMNRIFLDFMVKAILIFVSDKISQFLVLPYLFKNLFFFMIPRKQIYDRWRDFHFYEVP